MTPGSSSGPAGGGAVDRAGRLVAAVAAQGGRCLWCGTVFSPLTMPTTDHVVPRTKGGPSWAENEVAACRRCNADRGHTAPTAWFEECRRRGWPADGDALARCLDALDVAVADRGGQRRARPYLAAQRRRLARVLGAR